MKKNIFKVLIQVQVIIYRILAQLKYRKNQLIFNFLEVLNPDLKQLIL
jgi:hypothetical protein